MQVVNTGLSTEDKALIEQILVTWFEDEETGRRDLPQHKRWFMGGKDLDTLLVERFSDVLDRMLSGEFEHWQHSPDGALASVILLDQFGRNINRGSARAFAGDAQALAISRYALENGFPDQCEFTQSVFFYMPFMHDESVESQQQCVDLMRSMVNSAPENQKKFATSSLESAIEHQQIIEQFGRYPHRNEVLKRTSTAEESAWLEEKNQRFGQ